MGRHPRQDHLLGARPRERRRFLMGAAGALLAQTALGGGMATPTFAADARGAGDWRSGFVTTARDADGRYRLVLLDRRARPVDTLPLPDRGHGAAVHPASRHAVVFARRPGNWMIAFSLDEGFEARRIDAVPGRHFYGHGVYSQDGHHLYTTENDWEGRRGVIGVYAVDAGYRRVGEFDSGGIGPHELVRIPGTDRIVVANGGIETHPDRTREKLNLDSMQPSLAVLDLASGRGISTHRFGEDAHQVSLRHLAADDRGRVWFAGQYEGPDAVAPLLAGHLELRQVGSGDTRRALRTLALPDGLDDRHENYLASVAADARAVVFTAPRAGLALRYDHHAGRWDLPAHLDDDAGVAAWPRHYRTPRAEGDEHLAADGRFLVTGGFGDVAALDDQGLERTALHRWYYDNHVLRFG